VSWRLNEVERLAVATGRRLLRVASAGNDEIEFVFERFSGEPGELLLTIPVAAMPSVGAIDLPVVEEEFGRQYGIGVR
jgi:hypothetical protein